MLCTHTTLSDRMICRAWSRVEKRDAELSKLHLVISYKNSEEERIGQREKRNKNNLNSFHAVSRRPCNIAAGSSNREGLGGGGGAVKEGIKGYTQTLADCYSHFRLLISPREQN